MTFLNEIIPLTNPIPQGLLDESDRPLVSKCERAGVVDDETSGYRSRGPARHHRTRMPMAYSRKGGTSSERAAKSAVQCAADHCTRLAQRPRISALFGSFGQPRARSRSIRYNPFQRLLFRWTVFQRTGFQFFVYRLPATLWNTIH